ncbi:hypothetical protein SYNTR_1518 [Candidatus Syntrophocurvum alkaliphilum]|uniref:Putative Flp pilus-assembly TadG-like N-terminal domain-containing protein n=1 Tax=Candidatus Syntrophocurvum alkaliphilum TaxID=2293317 RepID=A0A6I6DLW5_9FIRM|nr:pilus assembly protein TadG-related protein [Candidatus Syntrophocurvum alkaliphilum]QGU00112.1 hypothetical protein SYNTR_1518 [Candidatus Syntrophocurvum alkaliphilum]
MKSIFLRLVKEEKGTVLVLVAAAMMTFCGFAALVTDAGLLYVNRAKLVNALDSAVLAGAQELPNNTSSALQVAENYARSNGLSDGEFTFELDGDEKITGTANRDVNLLFARVLGYDSAEVPATATARTGPLVGTAGIRPFGVLWSNIQKGEPTVLRPDNASEGSWCYLLELGGTGTSVIKQNIEEGYPGTIEVADVIDGERGVNMSTMKSVETLVADCNHGCTPESHKPGCSRIMIVPVVDIQQVNSSGQVEKVRVLSFAAFFVEQYHHGPKEIRGTFIDYVTLGDIDPNGLDFGLYGVELYK